MHTKYEEYVSLLNRAVERWVGDDEAITDDLREHTIHLLQHLDAYLFFLVLMLLHKLVHDIPLEFRPQ